ncbi:unnamed protein product [Pedinophyceae sp. YPF-701]|nr:unnamed protein product [Pedinophyceae sp. YPF-701]
MTPQMGGTVTLWAVAVLALLVGACAAHPTSGGNSTGIGAARDLGDVVPTYGAWNALDKAEASSQCQLDGPSCALDVAVSRKLLQAFGAPFSTRAPPATPAPQVDCPIEVDCSGNGSPTPGKCTCNCDSGWVTDPERNTLDLDAPFCDVREDDLQSRTGGLSERERNATTSGEVVVSGNQSSAKAMDPTNWTFSGVGLFVFVVLCPLVLIIGCLTYRKLKKRGLVDKVLLAVQERNLQAEKGRRGRGRRYSGDTLSESDVSYSVDSGWDRRGRRRRSHSAHYESRAPPAMLGWGGPLAATMPVHPGVGAALNSTIAGAQLAQTVALTQGGGFGFGGAPTPTNTQHLAATVGPQGLHGLHPSVLGQTLPAASLGATMFGRTAVCTRRWLGPAARLGQTVARGGAGAGRAALARTYAASAASGGDLFERSLGGSRGESGVEKWLRETHA